MHEDIITSIIIILPALVAWSVPKLRKCNGNWMISLKIVPIGFIALMVSDKIITRFYHWRCEYHLENIENFHYGIRSAIVLGSALLAIVIAGFLISRKFRSEKKFNPLPSILLFFSSLIPFAVIGFFISVITFNTNGSPGEWRSIYLPRENGDGFVFEQQSIHPFLAEYNYRLRFVRNRKSVCQQLFVNYGGRTHFNLYRLKDGRILFRDKDWDYVVDCAGQRVFRLEPLNGKLYIAEIPNENIDFGTGPYEKDGKIVMEMGKNIIPAEEATGILDSMVYYGCITDRFYSSAERSESKINKVRAGQ